MAYAAHSQPRIAWERFGHFEQGANCRTLVLDEDGSVVTFGAHSEGFCAIRYDENGNVVNNRAFNDINMKRAISSGDGGYVLVGYKVYNIQDELVVFGKMMKVNRELEPVWNRTYGDSSGEYNHELLDVIDDGEGYVAVGSRYPWDHMDDYWIIKVNYEGELIWERVIGTFEVRGERANQVIIDHQGRIVLGCRYYNEMGALEGCVMRLDGGIDTLICGYLLGFSSIGGLTLTPAGLIVYSCERLYRIDDEDQVEESERLELWWELPAYFHEPFQMIPAMGGGILLAGTYFQVNHITHRFDSLRVFLTRFDDELRERWRFYRLTNDTLGRGSAIAQAQDGSFYIGGQVNRDFWVAKTTPDPTSVSENDSLLNPETFLMHPAYPNPFNDRTNIRFDLLSPGVVEFAVFDPLGSKILKRVLLARSGTNILQFGTGDFPSGIYMAKITVGSLNKTQKLILLK